jgi:hypothetical protein
MHSLCFPWAGLDRRQINYLLDALADVPALRVVNSNADSY